MIGNRDIYLDRTKVNTFSLQLNHCGVQECTPGYSYSFDANSYHLIHFVLGGSGFLEINHRLINIHAGQAFYIPPGKILCVIGNAMDIRVGWILLEYFKSLYRTFI